MSLIIRKAKQEDIPAIYHITKEAFEKYAADLGLPQTVSALKENEETILNDMKKKYILIALLDGIPVGSVRYEILPGNVAYISRFGVKLDVQKCGVGNALVQSVEDDVRSKGVTVITLHTATKMTSLVRSYSGMGFYIHSTTTDRGYIRGLFCKELTHEAVPSLDCVNCK